MPSVRQENSARAALRRRGVYYSPEPLARLLAGWALQPARPARVLDPTCGDGVFLRQALDQLQLLGIDDATEQVFGIDIDPSLRRQVQHLLQRGVPISNFLRGDFLHVEPRQLGGSMDVVLGNPPYVRHHYLTDDTIQHARQQAAEMGVMLTARSDLWAYIVLHSLRFLAPSGRLGLVLPSAVLYADFARPLIRHLEDRFAQVGLIHVRERLFRQSAERTVVLLASGFGAGKSRSDHFRAASLAQLSEILLDLPSASSSSGLLRTVAADEQIVRPPFESRRERIAFEAFERVTIESSVPLGDLSTIKIGTVTGANQFFLRTRNELLKAGVLRGSIPIVSRSRMLKSPMWTEHDQTQLDDSGRPSRLLILSPDDTLSDVVLRWIADAELNGSNRTHHCSIRTPWYSLASITRPDALLPYMGSSPPRLIMNLAGSATTNSIHGVQWHRASAGRRAVLSSWTTIFGIGVELLGRMYGQGVLKIEPSRAKQLPMVLLRSSAGLMDVNRMARDVGLKGAIAEADRIVLIDGLGLDRRDVDRLRELQHRLQSFRVR